MSHLILADILDSVQTYDAEITVLEYESRTARLGRSDVSQHLEERTIHVTARAIEDGAIGCAVGTDSSREALRRLIAQARELAQTSQSSPSAVFPRPAAHEPGASVPIRKVTTTLEEYIGRAAARGAVISGSIRTGVARLSVANTYGVQVSSSMSEVRAAFTCERNGLSGYGHFSGAAYDEAAVDDAFERALSKVTSEKDAITLPAGEHPVIMEPEAFGELVTAFAWQSFSAKAAQDGRSFMAHRTGEQVTSPSFTLRDDVWHPQQTGLSIDYEGAAKQTVGLIEDGVALGVVHNAATAVAAQAETTGHALPAPDYWGPIPMNLVITGGSTSMASLLAAFPRAIHVTRLHYLNVEDEARTQITGMTRDGTFLIADGEIVAPLIDMRFTINALEAIGTMTAASVETRLVSTMDLSIVSPSVALGAFRFTGTKAGA